MVIKRTRCTLTPPPLTRAEQYNLDVLVRLQKSVRNDSCVDLTTALPYGYSRRLKQLMERYNWWDDETSTVFVRRMPMTHAPDGPRAPKHPVEAETPSSSDSDPPRPPTRRKGMSGKAVARRAAREADNDADDDSDADHARRRKVSPGRAAGDGDQRPSTPSGPVIPRQVGEPSKAVPARAHVKEEHEEPAPTGRVVNDYSQRLVRPSAPTLPRLVIGEASKQVSELSKLFASRAHVKQESDDASRAADDHGLYEQLLLQPVMPVLPLEALLGEPSKPSTPRRSGHFKEDSVGRARVRDVRDNCSFVPFVPPFLRRVDEPSKSSRPTTPSKPLSKVAPRRFKREESDNDDDNDGWSAETLVAEGRDLSPDGPLEDVPLPSVEDC